jgi:hypothetical protein
MRAPDIMGIISVLCVFGVPIIWMICHYAHLSLKSWHETALKRDMIARGYTAQEIIEILRADSGTRDKSPLPNVPPAKPIKQPVYSP